MGKLPRCLVCGKAISNIVMVHAVELYGVCHHHTPDPLPQPLTEPHMLCVATPIWLLAEALLATGWPGIVAQVATTSGLTSDIPTERWLNVKHIYELAHAGIPVRLIFAHACALHLIKSKANWRTR